MRKALIEILCKGSALSFKKTREEKDNKPKKIKIKTKKSWTLKYLILIVFHTE